MRSPAIQKLIDAVETANGSIKLYGSDPTEEHGTSFVVNDVPATFSVHTQDGALPSDEYDIQIEGIPPGDYLYAGVVRLDTFLKLVTQIQGREDDWPTMD